MNQPGFIREAPATMPPWAEGWSEKPRIRSVLCGVDLSEFSYRAFRHAAALARRFGAQLFVQHVIEPPKQAAWSAAGGMVQERLRGARRIAEEELRTLEAEADTEDLNITYVLNDGDPKARILDTLARRRIDLLVLGTHARKGARRLLEGSLSERLVREATCPVLVLSQPARELVEEEDTQAVRVGTILIATDFSRNSDRAVTCGLRWAAEWSSRVIFLHVVETGPPLAGIARLLPESDPGLEGRIRDAWEKLRMLVPETAQLSRSIEYEVRAGDPREQILGCAADQKADLIVMGSRGLGRLPIALRIGPALSSSFASLSGGTTTAGVIRDGRYPVLAIRHLGV